MELIGSLGVIEDDFKNGTTLGARCSEDDEDLLGCHIEMMILWMTMGVN